ncbi:hypothetical protein HanXRQr2_Chr04g0164321 [Helianthus annuus]|uniref:Uncharacterized protein n=1 Tax=Helianthus annuus TaxID=4232 RepID=A0A9K3J735_HELAN|nr:hypothetical protein HanXRQr2_Chr04g0164321 [Helianthus annuus]KAJ0931157.1 hypothetical protein HanPSC8_Chr04g0158251 [Helianthus annuus]
MLSPRLMWQLQPKLSLEELGGQQDIDGFLAGGPSFNDNNQSMQQYKVRKRGTTRGRGGEHCC